MLLDKYVRLRLQICGLLNYSARYHDRCFLRSTCVLESPCHTDISRNVDNSNQ